MLAQICKVPSVGPLAGKPSDTPARSSERTQVTAAWGGSQRGDLAVTAWLSWFLAALSTAARTNGDAVKADQHKGGLWWSHRHCGFNSRQRQLLNRLLDAKPAGFAGAMGFPHKAMNLTEMGRACCIQ